MSLKGVLAISGMPGLYKVIAQTKSGFIVESLTDNKRQPVSSTQRISMLEDISVYTLTDDKPLKEIFLKMDEYSKSGSIIAPKSDNNQLKEFFKVVVPDYDQERVYPSDIKKIISWFQLIKDILHEEDEAEVAETEPTEMKADKDKESGTEEA